MFWLIGTVDDDEVVRCHLRVITENNAFDPKEDPMVFSIPFVQRDDLCPLGVETASGMVWPGSSYGAEYGPCLAMAPLTGDPDVD